MATASVTSTVSVNGAHMRAAFSSFRLVRRLRLMAVLGTVVASAACATSPSPTSPSVPSPAGTAAVDSNQSFCTAEINRYRAIAGLPALGRGADLESFATQAIEFDARLGVPHQYFKQTNGGGVSRAENQLLLWKGYAVNEVIRQGLATMWAEGPTGSHYQILTGNYQNVGCGIFLSGNEVSVSQDFR